MPTRGQAAQEEVQEQEPVTSGEAARQDEATPGETIAHTPPAAADAAGDSGVTWSTRETATEAAATDTESMTTTQDGEWESRFKAEQARADDYVARWQRTVADMANMRRRHDQERQEYTKQATAALMVDLLPVLDSFDRALHAMPQEIRDLPWADGIGLVERQLRTVLERNGLSPIEAEGKTFDPNEHEAIMQESSDQPEDTVTGELQRGYKLHDRILRPSMVKVAKK